MVVLGALARLPPRGSAVVVLRYWADLSVEQVAGGAGLLAGQRQEPERSFARQAAGRAGRRPDRPRARPTAIGERHEVRKTRHG